MTQQRHDTLIDYIMRPIARRLAERIDELSEQTAILSDEEIPKRIPDSERFCTVSAGNGSFDPGMWDGASTICETTQLAVAMFGRYEEEETGTAEHMLFSDKGGMLSRYKPLLLRTVLFDRDASGNLVNWVPTDPEGNAILRSNIAPVSCISPREIETTPTLHAMTVYFSLQFDWGLE